MKGFITLANKLNRKDSITGLDVWYKTRIDDVEYKMETVRSVEGNVVNVGQVFVILIPFTGDYLPYSEWKSSSFIDKTYTVSPGDYIFIDTDINENITPDTVKSIKSKYEPYVCEIKSIQVVEEKYGISYQIKIEGV